MKEYKYSNKKEDYYRDLILDKSKEVGLFTLYEKIADHSFVPEKQYLLILERPNVTKELKQEAIKIIIDYTEEKGWEVLKINNKSLKIIGVFDSFNILVRELILLVFED